MTLLKGRYIFLPNRFNMCRKKPVYFDEYLARYQKKTKRSSYTHRPPTIIPSNSQHSICESEDFCVCSGHFNACRPCNGVVSV